MQSRSKDFSQESLASSWQPISHSQRIACNLASKRPRKFTLPLLGNLSTRGITQNCTETHTRCLCLPLFTWMQMSLWILADLWMCLPQGILSVANSTSCFPWDFAYERKLRLKGVLCRTKIHRTNSGLNWRPQKNQGKARWQSFLFWSQCEASMIGPETISKESDWKAGELIFFLKKELNKELLLHGCLIWSQRMQGKCTWC